MRGNVVARRQESQERNRWVLHVPNAPKTTAPVIPTSFALPPPSLQLATGTGRGSSSAEAFASAGALAVPGLAALRVRGEGAVESGEFGGVRPWIIFAEGRRAPRNFLAAGGVGTARCDGGAAVPRDSAPLSGSPVIGVNLGLLHHIRSTMDCVHLCRTIRIQASYLARVSRNLGHRSVAR